MTEFVAPPVEDFFRSQTIGVWVNQLGANHVGMTYLIASKNGQALGAGGELAATEVDGRPQAFDLHFLDDNRVANEPVNWSTCRKHRLAAVVELDEFTRVSFPVYLHNTVAKSAMRFGVDWLGNIGTIDAQGFYSPPANRPGFTCATYLCEVFRSHGLEVVDVDTWPADAPHNDSWVESLLARFRSKEGREQTIQSIQDTRPLMRLEPAEFAGAASLGLESWPVPKATANALASQIVDDFNSSFARTE